MKRMLLRLTGWALLLLFGYFLFSKAGLLPPPARLFRPASALIDETPMLVKEIRKISQLVTLNVQDEVVVSSLKPAPAGSARRLVNIFSTVPAMAMDRLVLVVKGEIQMGTELRGLNSEQVFINGDSISIQLPAATILDIQTNPSGTETFTEEGSWSPPEVTALKEKARAQLAERAISKGLIERANVQSLKVMESFLKTLGFKKVTVLTIRR